MVGVSVSCLMERWKHLVCLVLGMGSMQVCLEAPADFAAGGITCNRRWRAGVGLGESGGSNAIYYATTGERPVHGHDLMFLDHCFGSLECVMMPKPTSLVAVVEGCFARCSGLFYPASQRVLMRYQTRMPSFRQLTGSYSQRSSHKRPWCLAVWRVVRPVVAGCHVVGFVFGQQCRAVR